MILRQKVPCLAPRVASGALRQAAIEVIHYDSWSRLNSYQSCAPLYRAIRIIRYAHRIWGVLT